MHISNIVTIDFETTGKDAKTAFPIEYGFVDVNEEGASFGGCFIALPEGEKIPPETSAVHHIVDEDLEGAPSWPEVLAWMRRQFEIEGSLEGLVLVAHNAEYEQGILANTEFRSTDGAEPGFPGVQWICTFKCALVAFPDAPSHSNESLRYWLGVGNLGRKHGQGSHSALHDAKVTAGIFRALYGWFYADLCSRGLLRSNAAIYSSTAREAVIGRMIQVSKEIAVLPTCPIGKTERGKKWADVDTGFLQWVCRQDDMREDVKHAAKAELELRRKR